MSSLFDENRKVYVCGDFNIWTDDDNDNYAKQGRHFRFFLRVGAETVWRAKRAFMISGGGGGGGGVAETVWRAKRGLALA